MLAAQAKNNGLNLPIYGMYNIGQLWFFLILQNKEYAVSKAFDATDKDELKQIINAMHYVKAHIERNV
jgi:muconolactone delta-isomerase